MFSAITVNHSTRQFVHTALAIRTQDPESKMFSMAWEWVGANDENMRTVGLAKCDHMYDASRHPSGSAGLDSIEDPSTFSLEDVTEIDPITDAMNPILVDRSIDQVELSPLSALYLHGAVVNARKGQYCFAAVVVQRGPKGIHHLIYVMSQNPASFCDVGPRHYSFEQLFRYQKRVLEHVR